MSLAKLASLLLGACLSLFATVTLASLSLQAAVGPAGGGGFCPGGADGYFWTTKPTVSAGDTGEMFYTIYDVGPFCTIEPQFPQWTDSQQKLGDTPVGLSVTDDPNILNVTFTCSIFSSNCNADGSSVLNDFFTASAPVGCYSYSWQDRDAAGATQFGTGTICTGSTAVPEPGTLTLLGLGFAGFAVTRRRKLN